MNYRRWLSILIALAGPATAAAQSPQAVVASIDAKADSIDRKCGAFCSGTINRLARDIRALVKPYLGPATVPPPVPPPPPPPVVTPPPPPPVVTPPPPPPVVPPPPPPPVVPPPADGALLSETFAGMRSVADIQAAKWYGKSDYFSAARIGIDTTDGAPGGSGRSMVYQFPAGSGGVGVLMYRPSSTTEDWTEIWAKFSPNFASTGSCGGNNPDYKFVFWALQPNDARNEIKVGNYGEMRYLDTRYNAGPDVLRITAANPISSGQWHRYRVHNKVGASAVFTVEFWDGVNAPQRLAQTGFSLSYSSMNYLVLGANRNCTAASDQWLKWGSIRIYKTDPGWGF